MRIPTGEQLSRGDWWKLIQRAHAWRALLDESEQTQYHWRGQASAIEKVEENRRAIEELRGVGAPAAPHDYPQLAARRRLFAPPSSNAAH